MSVGGTTTGGGVLIVMHGPSCISVGPRISLPGLGMSGLEGGGVGFNRQLGCASVVAIRQLECCESDDRRFQRGFCRYVALLV